MIISRTYKNMHVSTSQKLALLQNLKMSCALSQVLFESVFQNFIQKVGEK
jgi:hypothetical protein